MIRSKQMIWVKSVEEILRNEIEVSWNIPKDKEETNKESKNILWLAYIRTRDLKNTSHKYYRFISFLDKALFEVGSSFSEP